MTYRFPIRVGDRVAIAPHHDLWMAGCRFGTVTDVNAYREEPGRAYSVDLDTGRNVTLSHDDLLGAVGDTPDPEVDDEHLHHLVTKARRGLKARGLNSTIVRVSDALRDEWPLAYSIVLAVHRALVTEAVTRQAIKAVLTSLLSEEGENPEYDRALVEAGRDLGVTIEPNTPNPWLKAIRLVVESFSRFDTTEETVTRLVDGLAAQGYAIKKA